MVVVSLQAPIGPYAANGPGSVAVGPHVELMTFSAYICGRGLNVQPSIRMWFRAVVAVFPWMKRSLQNGFFIGFCRHWRGPLTQAA